MTMQQRGTREHVIAVLEKAAAEMAEHHRGRHYMFWRQGNEREIDAALANGPPFDRYRQVWIFTGDGGGAVTQARFGSWAIDRLVSGVRPKEILSIFEAEAAENIGRYTEVSPLFGVQIDADCPLAEGLSIEPEREGLFARLLQANPFQRLGLPTGTAILRQSYTVVPAYREQTERNIEADASVTSPVWADREATRRRVRLACLLVSGGAVELPLSILEPKRDACLVAGEGNSAGQPFQAHPLVSFPVLSSEVGKAFAQLGEFREFDSLARAIDRLGRARLAVSEVDKALELGMAAEIALMHDHRKSNTEIRYKISNRAAWLVGSDPVERAAVFEKMRDLYDARSSAVHTGSLSSKSKVDLASADALIARILSAILALGRFPDWSALTMGGEL
ncbi:hypothetical protein [Novosphingobium sp.]|uniref:hypothetical protein n=1 Tax=Novosphingobium sp. TaxID=1874826 RepID=UPI0035B4BE2E